MAKLLIASDLHGSAYYTKLLMDRIAEEKADRILLLGDLLYHGPRNDLPRDYAPKQVIAMLNSLKNEILCVRGNCDTEVDQMVLPDHGGLRGPFCRRIHGLCDPRAPFRREDASASS